MIANEVRKGDRWICVDRELKNLSFKCAFIVIYAPNDRQGRQCLWMELSDLKSFVESFMVFIGDFNEVLAPEEKKGGMGNSGSMKDFKD